MSVATKVLAWTNTGIHAGTAVAAGNSRTFTFSLTAGWEIQIPCFAFAATASLDSGVYVYPTSDGGANYDTEPLVSFSIRTAAAHSALKAASVRLTTGQYAVELRASSPTCTFGIRTCLVITAVNIA